MGGGGGIVERASWGLEDTRTMVISEGTTTRTKQHVDWGLQTLT